MKKIKAQPLTKENFSTYGNFANILNPEGNHLGNFYADQVIFPVSGEMPVAFSTLICEKPEKMIVTTAEFHNTTGEAFVTLDDDIVLHVAPPSKEPVPKLTEAFIVPKGTVVKLNTGVWHLSAIPINIEKAHVLIVLPERTYCNDCIVVDYEEEDYIEIVL